MPTAVIYITADAPIDKMATAVDMVIEGYGGEVLLDEFEAKMEDVLGRPLTGKIEMAYKTVDAPLEEHL